LELTFEEITQLALKCKFSDCTHAREKGCAIVAALKTGELSEERLKNYLKLRKETEFNDMSLAQRRTRDKAFGKLVKNVIKNHRRYQR